MKSSGTNQALSQAGNRALVLRTLQHMKRATRVELARRTGLKQATIGNIVKDFIDWGLLEETGAVAGSKGRRAVGVQFAGGPYRVIALRLTRRDYTVGAFGLDGTEADGRVTMPIDGAPPKRVLEAACDAINALVAAHPEWRVLAVGAAVPGAFFRDTGEIAMITAMPGWRDVRVREILEARLSLPVVVDHDANAGAVAESALVPERDMDEAMVYVSAGQGIGAGIVNGGEVYAGALGVAGEIGHTCVDVHGALCECGRRGCLTQYVSTLALARDVGARLGTDAMTFEEAAERVRAGEPEAAAAFTNLLTYLGAGVLNLVYAYNPARIVIGDALSTLGQPLLDGLDSQLRSMRVMRLAEHVKLELARLGPDSAYPGAAAIAARYVFEHVGTMCGL